MRMQQTEETVTQNETSTCDMQAERLAWLMGENTAMPFADWVQLAQSTGVAARSYVVYTDRMAALYTLSVEKKAAVLDALIEEMLVRGHRPLTSDLEAVVLPMVLRMRQDAEKYKRRCDQRSWRGATK